MFTPEQITKELQRIQGTIPACYMNNVVKDQLTTPTIKKVAELALEEGIPEAKKEQLRTILASGDLDTVQPTENPKVAEKINRWVDKKIKESIKAKRLPSIKELKKHYENKKTTTGGDATSITE